MVLNNDVVIFNSFFHVGKFLGVVPVTSTTWNKIIPTVYILIYTSIVVASITGRFVTYYKYMEMKRIIMELLQSGSQSIFIIIFIYGSFRNNKKWNLILKYANTIDRSFNNCHYCNSSKIKLIIPIVVTIVIYVVIAFLDGIYNNLGIFIYYRMYAYSNVYDLYLLLFIFNMTLLICRRIRMLNKTLKTVISKNFSTQGELEKELRSIILIFTRCGTMVKNINIVLGWSIFFYLPYSMVNFLNLLDILVSNSYSSNGGVFAYTAFSFFYIVSKIKLYIKTFMMNIIYFRPHR